MDDYLDAIDSISKWCLAVVKEIDYDRETITIQYFNWSETYNLNAKFDEKKFRPVWTKTINSEYTGGNQTEN